MPGSSWACASGGSGELGRYQKGSAQRPQPVPGRPDRKGRRSQARHSSSMARPRMMRHSAERSPMSSLTHFDAQGQAHMVDVAAKPATHRVAVATGRIEMQAGDPGADRIGHREEGRRAGHRAHRRHPGRQEDQRPDSAVPPAGADARGGGFRRSAEGGVPQVVCTATVETVGPTGVEMEALTAVQVALLTIYDMCKAVDRGMTITDVHVLEKHGGKSGSYRGGRRPRLTPHAVGRRRAATSTTRADAAARDGGVRRAVVRTDDIVRPRSRRQGVLPTPPRRW